MVRRRRFTQADAPATPALLEAVRSLARPLRDPGDLDPLLERIGDARCVLLGEASHGTADYYTWRAALSRRLIVEKGFSFIAVEGDWPDCYRVNRYVKHRDGVDPTARDVLHAFERWPTWMWANEEVVALAEWLRRHNDRKPEGERVGFYGLDVYSLWDSLYQVMTYLRKENPSALPAACARLLLLRAIRRGRSGLRPRHGVRLGLLRERGDRPVARSCARAPGGTTATATTAASRRSRTPWSSRTPRPITGP